MMRRVAHTTNGQSAERAYHRWVLVGCTTTNTVMVLLTKTAEQSEMVFRGFEGDLFPGETVRVVEPEVVGVLDDKTELV